MATRGDGEEAGGGEKTRERESEGQRSGGARGGESEGEEGEKALRGAHRMVQRNFLGLGAGCALFLSSSRSRTSLMIS